MVTTNLTSQDLAVLAIAAFQSGNKEAFIGYTQGFMADQSYNKQDPAKAQALAEKDRPKMALSMMSQAAGVNLQIGKDGQLTDPNGQPVEVSSTQPQ